MSLRSYAQHFEDVMLSRAFPARRGFYVDVGAHHPDVDSVTRLFYLRGWTGINIEPLEDMHALLEQQRPRDVNLLVAVGSSERVVPFYETIDALECSTTNPDVAGQHMVNGQRIERYMVQQRRLGDVLTEYALDRDIDFIKIDVKGAELDVLRGADLERHRPKMLVVETKVPMTPDRMGQFQELGDRNEEIQRFLEPLAYHPVYFDGLNSFFVAEPFLDLARHFTYPPGIFDRLPR